MSRLIAVPHPFRTESVTHEVPDGLTLADMLEHVQCDPILRRHAHIWIGDHYVPAVNWRRVRPRAGAVVTVKVYAQGGGGGGGGKDPLRTILTLAVVAATIAAQVYLGPFAAAGVAILGNLLVNTVAPIRPPTLGDLSGYGGGSNQRDSPTLFIDGARNTARPFGTVPVVLGTHKHVPPLGALSYSEVVGDANYLRMLVVWGYGPLKIEDIKIGETPIANFTDVQIETREGRVGDAAITLFPDSVNQDSFAITLEQASDWQTRSAGTGADELSVDITFPSGLVQFGGGGSRGSRSVSVQIQYREVGGSPAAPWSTPTFTAATVDAAWIDGDTVTFTHNRTSAIRHGFRWSVPARGDYEVRIRRTTTDTDDSSIFDACEWSALRSITDEDPISFPSPLAVTALVIKATDQLNRVVDDLNATVSSYVNSYTGGSPAWAEAVSSNPADLFRHVLQGAANAQALSDSRVDVDKLQDWHAFCAAAGFEFNMVRDFQASVWDTLADIAAAGRGSPTQVDGKWSVVYDYEQTVPVQHFTPRNSWGFELEKSFPDVPHAFRVRFSNREKNWAADERVVYADGYTSANATDFESLDAPGITDPDHVWKFARFHLAQALLRPERWSLNVDFEYLVAQRGDLVMVTHDVLLVGLAAGRIKALTRVQDYAFDFTTGAMPAGASLYRAPADYNGSYFDSSGALRTAVGSAPRFTYDPVTNALDGLLNEPVVINAFLHSEDVSQSAWGGGTGMNRPAALNVETAPDGTSTADGLVATAFTGEHSIGQNVAVTGGTTRTITIHAKAGALSWLWIGEVVLFTGLGWFHLSGAGAVGGTSGSGAGNIVERSIEALDDGWYRLRISIAYPSTGTSRVRIGLATGDLNNSFLGDNATHYAFVWGGQNELGDEPTTYIPTAGSTQAHGADVLTLDVPDGTYDVEVVRLSGSVSVAGATVSGGYTVPTDSSPVRSVSMERTDPGDVAGVTVDEVLTMEAGTDYGVSIRTADNAALTRQVVTSAGAQTSVTFATVIPSAQAPAVGDLFGFGVLGSETIRGLLLSIEPMDELTARLVCVPESAAIYAADTGTIPAFDSKITAVAGVPDAEITNIRSDESALQLGSGNTLVPHIAVSVAAVQDTRVRLEVQARAAATNEPFYAAAVTAQQGGDQIIGGVEQGRSYDVRVRWRDVNDARLPGGWATVYAHRVVGQTSAPGALVNATISVFGGQALIRWDRPADLDVRFGGEVRFRHSPATDADTAAWQSSTSIGTAAKGDALFATLPLKPGTYLARVFDKGGRPSEVVALSTKQASVLAFANVSTITESPDFTGGKSNVVAADGTLRLTGTGLFDDIDDLDDISDLDAFGGIAVSGTYTFAAGLDLGSVNRVRLTSVVDATSINTLDKIDERTESIDVWEDFDGTTQAAADCRVQVRYTDDDPAGSPVAWSVWNDLDAAEFEARGFQFRAVLTTEDAAFNIRVDSLGVIAEDV